MNNPVKFLSIRLAIAAASLAASMTSSHAQSATATISDVPNGGVFDYTITLQNTGSTSLNSLWYGWTINGNNLSSVPTSPGNTLGWGNSVLGNSIEWVNSTGTTLAPGQAGTFTFISTSTPTQITASPSGESVAYVNGIDFSQNFAGSSTQMFSPTLVAAPEPSSVGLLLTGLFVLIGLLKGPTALRTLWRTPKAAAVRSVRPLA